MSNEALETISEHLVQEKDCEPVGELPEQTGELLVQDAPRPYFLSATDRKSYIESGVPAHITPFDAYAKYDIRRPNSFLLYFLIDPITLRAFETAGFTSNRARKLFILIRVVCLANLFVCDVYAIPILAFLIFFLPLCLFRVKAQIRQSRLLSEIPNLLNALALCLEIEASFNLLLERRGRELLDACPLIQSALEGVRAQPELESVSVTRAIHIVGERNRLPELMSLAEHLELTTGCTSKTKSALATQTKAIFGYWNTLRRRQFRMFPGKAIIFFVVFALPLILCTLLGPALVTAVVTEYF